MFKSNLNFINFGKSFHKSFNQSFQYGSLFKTIKKFYFSYPCPRKLREIVKITLFEREQPNKIKEIWQKYYDEKPHAFGMDITAPEMNMIIEKAKQNPFFIFPVSKPTGYFVLLCQNQDKSFIYTYLEDYKKNPHNATPYLVITMFDELVFKKGVGLVRGDIIGDLCKKDCEIIFNLTKQFYTNETNYNSVVTFNKESDNFNVQEHLDYCLKYYN